MRSKELFMEQREQEEQLVRQNLKMKITKPKEAHHLLISYHRAFKEHRMKTIKDYAIKLAPMEEAVLILAYGFQKEYGYYEKKWVIDAYYDLDWYGKPRCLSNAYRTVKKLEHIGFATKAWSDGDAIMKTQRLVLTIRGEEWVKGLKNTLNKHLLDYGGIKVRGKVKQR